MVPNLLGTLVDSYKLLLWLILWTSDLDLDLLA
jgi:hypothetical protein